MRVPENRLRVIVPQDIGGSFGIKAMIYPYMALMAACARLTARPVKWIEDRVEHLLASASGTDRKSTLEAAVGRDGCIQAIRVNIRENVGAYLRAPEPSCIMRSLTTFCGPYRIEHGEIDAVLRADQQATDRTVSRLWRAAAHLFARTACRPGGGGNGHRPHRGAPPKFPQARRTAVSHDHRQLLRQRRLRGLPR